MCNRDKITTRSIHTITIQESGVLSMDSSSYCVTEHNGFTNLHDRFTQRHYRFTQSHDQFTQSHDRFTQPHHPSHKDTIDSHNHTSNSHKDTVDSHNHTIDSHNHTIHHTTTPSITHPHDPLHMHHPFKIQANLVM